MKNNFPLPDGRPVIVPSVLSADFSDLGRSLRGLDKAAGWVQVDVMDGHFVPNLSFGPHIAGGVKKAARLPLDAHLMVERPGLFIDPFARAGADLITVHEEAQGPAACLRRIKALGLRAGLALKPKTPLERALKYFDRIDLLLLMTVEPGFGGQEFLSFVLAKIARARAAIGAGRRKIWLQVDGGINDRTAPEAVKAGADSLVMGSALFSRRDPARYAGQLLKRIGG
ncbi:MAG: ribulose-phosphate 3-epimerase [Elusimicrobia bacterium RIFOXYB2_FULL_62_6]|nr:MAG: ribulose-phosphate 3-epimerase [Elusimicrobia bacterium RIFOXYB2_FULL_62_6]